jgi:hypothetical protein
VSNSGNGDASTGDGSPAPPSIALSVAGDERIRLLKAVALGFTLGLLLARWGEIASS